MNASLAEPAHLEIGSGIREEFARDVRTGLGGKQKQLPSKYLYDAVGSALFEAITLLPEYGLTRADERLVCTHAAEIVELVKAPVAVAELGSGSGRKAIPLLRAILSRQPAVSYYPIDVSAAALEQCRREAGLLPGARVQTFHGPYLESLRRVVESRRPGERLLILFLGSSVGNFSHSEAVLFLTRISQLLRPADALLLGTDLVKPSAELIRAYDDPAGVTAAFNLNLLSRINHELNGDFQVRHFRHEARWRPEARRIEMHLRSLVKQTADIPGAGCRAAFESGETIWTESSYKFEPAELSSLAAQAGFRAAAQWIDGAWPFAENLWIPSVR